MSSFKKFLSKGKKHFSPKEISTYSHQLVKKNIANLSPDSLIANAIRETAKKLIISKNFINLTEKIIDALRNEDINNKIFYTIDPNDSFRVLTTRLQLAGDTKDKDFEEFYLFLSKLLLTSYKENEKNEQIQFFIKFVSLGDSHFYNEVLPNLTAEQKQTLTENLLVALEEIKKLTHIHIQKAERDNEIKACFTANTNEKQSLIESSFLSSALIPTVVSLVDSDYSANPKAPPPEDKITLASDSNLVNKVKNTGNSLAQAITRGQKTDQDKLSHQEILALISARFKLAPQSDLYSQDLANLEVFEFPKEQDFKENPCYISPVKQSSLSFFKQENNQSSTPTQEIEQTVSSNANPLTAIFSRSSLL